MPRLSSSDMLGLAALLVALILGVVLFAELPAIIASSARPQGTPAPAAPNPRTPAPTPASPARRTIRVATELFTLEAPAGWHYSLRTSGEGSSNSATLSTGSTQDPPGLDSIHITASRSPGVRTVDPQASQSQQRTQMEQTFGSVGTCVSAAAMKVGGVSGLVTGYLYSRAVNGHPTPVCDVYWVGTRESAQGNYSYAVEYAVPRSGYTEFAPLAEQVRGSVTWFE